MGIIRMRMKIPAVISALEHHCCAVGIGEALPPDDKVRIGPGFARSDINAARVKVDALGQSLRVKGIEVIKT